jgi:DNA polymerase III sliding clamp (beta) subunit (PCNA family)
MNTTTLTILAHILPAMAILAADKKDRRERIRGVYMEVSATEIRFAATNGVVMGVCRIEQDNPDITETIKCIIPAELIAGIKGHDTLTLEIGEPSDERRLQRELTISQGGAKQSMQSIPEDYPDYRRAIPETTSGEPAQFDVDLLIQLKKFGKALRANKGFFAIAYNGENTAMADFHMENLIVVINPFRNDEKYRAAPESPAWSREFI